MDPNPVSQLLDSLPDSRMTVGLGEDSRRRIRTKLEEDDSHTQVVTIREAAEQAKLTMGLTVAIDALRTAVAALAPLIETQNQAADATLEAITALNLKINALNLNLGTLITLQTAANQMAQQSLAAAQQTAASAATGTPYFAEWSATQLTGGPVTLLTAAQVQADKKAIRAMLACSTLVGSILGGSARIYVYHCAGANDAWSATGAVVIGNYPIASGASYAVGNGRTIPAGRYLRAQATNGGCSISLDVA